VLDRLAGNPEILNPMARFAARGLQMRGKLTEYLRRITVNHQQRFTAQPGHGSAAPLADSHVDGDLRTEPELGNRYG